MSDGTTGFQVAPTEDEAMKISDMFTKAANAIVAASTLPQEIQRLRDDVARLTNQLQDSKLHSDALEQTIVELRQQRDEANSRAENYKFDLETTKRTLDNTQAGMDVLRGDVDTISGQLANVKRERDDYGLQVMELEEKFAKSEARLGEIKDRMKQVFGLHEPEPPKAEPEPVPAPVVDTRPWWEKQESEAAPNPVPAATGTSEAAPF